MEPGFVHGGGGGGKGGHYHFEMTGNQQEKRVITSCQGGSTIYIQMHKQYKRVITHICWGGGWGVPLPSPPSDPPMTYYMYLNITIMKPFKNNIQYILFLFPRDEPKKVPVFVAANAANEGCTITPQGENLFAAVK